MIEIEFFMTRLGCSKCESTAALFPGLMKKYAGNVTLTEIDVRDAPTRVVELGITSTPAIVINGELYEGNMNEEELEKKIQELL